MKRYAAIAVFNRALSRVVLIHKQKPSWQKDLANFPGGKVEDTDWPCEDHRSDNPEQAYRNCIVREFLEETGVQLTDVSLFCTLVLGDAECRFFCAIGDVDAVQTKETEVIFVAPTWKVLAGSVSYEVKREDGLVDVISLKPMPNLPWLTAMALQLLRNHEGEKPPYTVQGVDPRKG